MIDELKAQSARRELDQALKDPTVRRDLDLLMATEGKTRQAEHRERMKADGYKQVTVWLSKSAQKKIDKLMKQGTSQSDAVNQLIEGKK